MENRRRPELQDVQSHGWAGRTSDFARTVLGDVELVEIVSSRGEVTDVPDEIVRERDVNTRLRSSGIDERAPNNSIWTAGSRWNSHWPQ